MPFEFKRMEIPDVILVTARAFGDPRGFFMETYKRSQFEAGGIPQRFVQGNYSHSTAKGVIRGLHYQMNPTPQGKLVWCLRGEIFDVAVDIRKGSPWYGKYVGQTLTGENKRMLWVPEGFAHGFMVLSEVADVLYQVNNEWDPKTERSIIWNDPGIGIQWPYEGDPILSDKDAVAPALKSADNNFVYEGRK